MNSISICFVHFILNLLFDLTSYQDDLLRSFVLENRNLLTSVSGSVCEFTVY